MDKFTRSFVVQSDFTHTFLSYLCAFSISTFSESYKPKRYKESFIGFFIPKKFTLVTHTQEKIPRDALLMKTTFRTSMW
jgi:hypothetical protein